MEKTCGNRHYFVTLQLFCNMMDLRQAKSIDVNNFLGISELLWVWHISREVKVCFCGRIGEGLLVKG